MTQAAQDINLSEAARKRSDKSLRGAGQYTGNLRVYTQAANKNSAESQSGLSQCAIADAVSATDAARRSLLQQKNAANHEWIGRRSKVSPTGKKILTLPAACYLVAGSLVVGTLSGALWVYNGSETEPLQSTSSQTPSTVNPEVDPENRLVDNGSNTLDETLESSYLAQIDTLGGQLTAAQSQNKEYEQEIGNLRDENMSLQGRMDGLSSEALQLNQELLAMDLKIVQTQDEAQAVVDANTEQRVVYNFVNVPVGQESSTIPPPTQPSAVQTIEPAIIQPVISEPTYVDQFATDMEMILEPDEGLRVNPQYDPSLKEELPYPDYNPGPEDGSENNSLIDTDTPSAAKRSNIEYAPISDDS